MCWPFNKSYFVALGCLSVDEVGAMTLAIDRPTETVHLSEVVLPAVREAVGSDGEQLLLRRFRLHWKSLRTASAVEERLFPIQPAAPVKRRRTSDKPKIINIQR